MKSQRLLVGGTIVFILGVFFFWQLPKAPDSNLSDITRIPVHFCPASDRPYIKIEIEGVKYSCLVDLGSSHPIDLQDKYINHIINKTQAGEAKYYDAKGVMFVTQKYRIPKIKIEDVLFQDIFIYKENSEFLNKESQYWHSFWNLIQHKMELLTIQGRVGRKPFEKLDSLFDFPHSSIFFLKDLASSIASIGYSMDQLVSVPFQIESCGVVLTMETEDGIKKLCLDTGATHSVLRNSSLKSEAKVTLKMGSHNFGVWHFKAYPLSDELPCDGILGVDFFKKHLIGFSLQNQMVYIQPLKDHL